MNNLLKVAIRQQALYIPEATTPLTPTLFVPIKGLLAANLSKLGFGVTEDLLRAINRLSDQEQQQIINLFREITNCDKNWTPLVKDWGTPTNETIIDHITNWFYNTFSGNKGERTQLPCGHTILPNTFPLDRYNGCPLCGTTFDHEVLENYGNGCTLKVLELWTTADLLQHMESLLTSKTALDASQVDSLKILLQELPLPAVKIAMKETLMLAIDTLIAIDPAKVQPLLASPTDILRYLWYKHTGHLQLLEPKVILNRMKRNNRKHFAGAGAHTQKIPSLDLKYNRATCLIAATWLNNMQMDIIKMCETMHPKRNMWVRFIRALRLAEYAKRTGFDQLRALLDMFYNEQYEVWQGRLNHFRLKLDPDSTFYLLQQRPGLFARSLFANMLWFGEKPATAAFSKVIDKVPARLVLSLQMYAANYFHGTNRAVKPLGGVNKFIAANKLLHAHTYEQRISMIDAVTDLCFQAMRQRFAAIPSANKTIYIDPALFHMPLAIGDRAESVQDLPSALMGTKFPLKGDQVRLFMQWGAGLRAQHLDMDLSCMVYYPSKVDTCSFSRLTTVGCQHSGDIRHIPDQIGTAEYINLDITALQKAGARHVVFTSNAYTAGALSPNMVVGWMDSAYPMRITARGGVAYDPSCVQHSVRITSNLSKGLVFGVLDVAAREIIWLEMAFNGQIAQQLHSGGVQALLAKLNSKMSIGALLQIKAEAQQLTVTDTEDADESYTFKWARDSAAVTKLLVD
ncbi:hypothetical protein [Chitinophaga sp. Cy-1792]|uniref:hypothetical protein n=1 Tax=Chitinophaga sp. Cy-1792 TaxID=2608339 RepID=UPI001966139E|nr:hypothetical protein [Chitinophaga sp. Cy-1792]